MGRFTRTGMATQHRASAACAILAALSLSACQEAAPQSLAAPATPLVQPAGSSTDLGALDEDVGSVLVVSWAGPTITPGVRALIEGGRVGGVLLFSSNFNGPAGLK